MDPIIIGCLGLAALFVLLALGVHIGIALGAVGMIGMAFVVGFQPAVMSATGAVYHKIASFELVTIPLFILMGYLASGGGVSKNVFKVLNYWVGSIRGGLGISTVVSCTAFGTVCGSSLVTASVFSRMCAPEMRHHGYHKNIAYGICASGGMIGMLIPPSILMVVYGILAGESIGKLLIAGVVPGLILMLFFALTIIGIARFKPSMIEDRGGADVGWRTRFKSLLEIWQILLVAVVIFGGIFGGIFNPTEAAAVASFVLLIIILLTRFREAKKLLHEAFMETGSTTAMIFLVMGGAAVFSHFLVLSGITQELASYVIGLNLSNMTLILVLLLLYAVLGCFLDSISMLCITIPLFQPIITAAGIDPIWYAVLIVMVIEIGLLTPPVGLNVYGAYAVAEPDVKLEGIFAGVLPFFLACWVAVAALMIFPSLSTFLPNLMWSN